MIVKNLSRSNAGGGGQLVKYIFRYIFRDQGTPVITKQDLHRPIYIPKGIKVTAKDIHHLYAERADAELLADLKGKYPSMNIKAYVENYLVPKAQFNENSTQVKSGKAQNSPFVIKHNIRGNSINGFIREFEANERGRIHKRKDATVIHHSIISWSNKDSPHITEKMLRDMSREYIKLRGENNLYVGTVHLDREHVHLHVAMGGTTIDGKSSRISKKEFEEVKIKLQEYQLKKYPELSHSLPEHGKANREKEKEALIKNVSNRRLSEKESILKCIETNFFKAETTKHFISLLNENGYNEYFRNGKLTGIQTEKYKYRFSSLGLKLDSLHEKDVIVKEQDDTLKELRQARSKENKELRADVFKTENSIEPEPTLSDTERQALEAIKDIRGSLNTGRNLDFEMDLAPDDLDSERDTKSDQKNDRGNDSDEIDIDDENLLNSKWDHEDEDD